MAIVAGYRIRRGRTSELEQTGTGNATITMIDTNGELDPAGAGGSTALDPMTPIAIALGGEPLFVGFVSRLIYDMYPNMEYAVATVECVDALDLMAAIQMVADPDLWGDPTAEGIFNGDIRFDRDTQVNHRINQVLDQMGWPAGNREIFTGNIRLQRTVYAPGQSALNAIRDAADAEFPGIANFYIGKDGTATFHGRLARFNPTDPQYHITTWECGDLANSAGRAVIFGLEYDVDKDRIINQAFCTPEGISDRNINGQYVRDASSIATHGTRAWAAENLIVEHSWLTGRTGRSECRNVFAQYYVTNYSQPQERLTRLTFKWLPDGAANAAEVNALMSGIDISDRIYLETVNGFDGHHFVEGLEYVAGPATAEYNQVTLNVDVSPAAYWNTLPS